MKKIILLFSLLAFSAFAFAQNTYNVNNETLELKTEVEGTLDLLWNTFNGKYRYFIKNEDEKLVELTNEKGSDNKYNNAYQSTLNLLTGNDASKTKLTLPSLTNYVNSYNAAQDPSYSVDNTKSKLKLRLGLFGGLTNNPFVTNPNNETTTFIGSELEVVSDDTSSRHGGFINLRHAFESDEFQYSATQIAIGYRYRFINKANFNIYGQTKFATVTSTKATIVIPDPDTTGSFITTEDSSTGFDAPLIFGLGADIKLGNGYLTLVYDSLFAVFIDNQDNFPIDFAIGYKFKL